MQSKFGNMILAKNKKGVVEKLLLTLVPIVLVLIVSGSLFFWMREQQEPTALNKKFLARDLVLTANAQAATQYNSKVYYTKLGEETESGQNFEFSRFLYEVGEKEVKVHAGADPVPASYPRFKNAHHTISKAQIFPRDEEGKTLKEIVLTKDGSELTATNERSDSVPIQYDCPPYEKLVPQAITVDPGFSQESAAIAREVVRQNAGLIMVSVVLGSDKGIAERKKLLNPKDTLLGIKIGKENIAKAYLNKDADDFKSSLSTACKVLNKFAGSAEQLAIVPLNLRWVPEEKYESILGRANAGFILEVPSSLSKSPQSVERLIAQGFKEGVAVVEP